MKLTAAMIDDLLVKHGKGDDGFHTFARAIETAALAATAAPEQAIAAGKAEIMPGASGFTMACFNAVDVPAGTNLYFAATAAPACNGDEICASGEHRGACALAAPAEPSAEIDVAGFGKAWRFSKYCRGNWYLLAASIEDAETQKRISGFAKLGYITGWRGLDAKP